MNNINVGRIRGINSRIRGGSTTYSSSYLSSKNLKQWLSAVLKICTRRVSDCTLSYLIHQEIEDIIVLKNNKGTEDNRVRKLDYSIQLSELFYKRFIEGGDISLFSPQDVPDLYDAFGTPEFDELYEKYERATSIKKKKVSNPQELFLSILKERAETGRIYIMNVDHCNTHSSFKDVIRMSNPMPRNYITY